MKVDTGFSNLFNQYRDNILRLDPVYFCARYLTVDGKPLRLEGSGYKPFADIYRYIGLSAIEKNAKPVVLVKGRQVGATTMAAALECYFTASGLFGNNNRPPMRLIHLFPTLSLAAAYTKDKLDPIIGGAKPVPGTMKNNGLPKSFMENMMDSSSTTNNNMHFKKFLYGNQIWIESTGLDGDRVRGRQLNLDTELPTPNYGFIKLRYLKEGDQLFDENGCVCNIIKLHPINKSPEAYRITFDDGTIVDACAEHLWFINNSLVKKTKELIGQKDIFIQNFLPERFNTDEITVKNTKFYIKKIEPIDPVPMRCITVDSPSHLYLITRSFIPTHNTGDGAFFDECFPYDQLIETEIGKVKIGKLYDNFILGKKVPLVKTFNELTECFEYNKITNAWNRGRKDIFEILCGNRKIQCTANHKFLTKRGWIELKNLVVGDLIKTTQPEQNQICYSLNRDQEQVLLGSFLGDGHISYHGLKKYRIRERHGLEQKDYCQWKANLFGTKIDIINKNGFSGKMAVSFSTKLFGYDKDFPKTKTTCPQWVLDRLDARGLAVWFMDDGSVNKGCGAVFYTSSFDEDSQKRIVSKLKSMGIDCDYRFYKVKNKKSKGYFAIYINKKNYRKLCSLIGEYVHDNLLYKIVYNKKNNKYRWNGEFSQYGLIPVKKIHSLNKTEIVYDISVEKNHNFIITSCRHAKKTSGIIAHNCQDMSDLAIGAVTKVLAQARYGSPGEGVQVYFGTPKTKGGSYWEMWQNSSQQYYHLRCEKCGKYFPLYRPDVKWEDIWIYGLTVRCTECGHEQDKLEAQERGKWIAMNPYSDHGVEPDFVGFHLNQLYIPHFTREVIEKAKPERSPINTERVYMNEVLGEFYDGQGGTITAEEIREKCIDKGRKMVKYIHGEKGKRVYAGFDWGQRGMLEQMSGRGKKGSYSCAVIITAEGNLFNIEFATRLMKPDPEEKEGTVEEMFRRYNPTLAVGDIGDAYDLTHRMQRTYDERFLASRAQHRVIGHIKYSKDEWPKTIVFEKDYYISEILGLLKEGRIKFPGGHHYKIGWLIEHCASMDIKITKDKSGEPLKKYVKGSGANDGLMALLNAYLAWKFDVTQGFSIANPLHMKYDIAENPKPIQAIVGYVPGMFGG